ncbi:MAG: 4Fe-4S cluster-binding domain-containing protein [Clostridia bacterium]
MSEYCTQCPRECKINRIFSVGYCLAPAHFIISKAYKHFWEEPCISGTSGSGTIFFSGCNLQCVYCQNQAISHKIQGRKLEASELVDLMLSLQDQGAHNINLVTPAHYAEQLVSTLILAKKLGLSIPIVYNTHAYELVQSLKALDGLIDIYLPDCKYLFSKTAKNYSHASNYPLISQAAIEEMVRQQPRCIISENDIMQKGVIIRHLLLPEQLSESKQLMKKLFKHYGNSVIYSIMNQYTPMSINQLFPELNNYVSNKDYDNLIDFCIDFGMENAFIQEEGTATKSYIPDFNRFTE